MAKIMVVMEKEDSEETDVTIRSDETFSTFTSRVVNREKPTPSGLRNSGRRPQLEHGSFIDRRGTRYVGTLRDIQLLKILKIFLFCCLIVSFVKYEFLNAVLTRESDCGGKGSVGKSVAE